MTSRQGFALPVVLGGLLVTTVLFATAQRRSVSHLGQLEGERRALVRMAEQREALSLAQVLLASSPEVRKFIYPDQKKGVLVFQDVGGLIDLNTAHPDLLDRLAEAVEVPAGGVERLRSWRRTGLRLLALDDFRRLTGVPRQHAERLSFLATVMSGRFGIDPDVAPKVVLDIARGGSPDVSEALVDQATSSVFAVWLVRADELGTENLGTLQLVEKGKARILEFN